MKKIYFLIVFAAVISFAFIWLKDLGFANKKDVPGIKTIVPQKSTENDVELRPNVTYTKIGGKSLKMHLLIPRKETGPKPLIVFIKGSAWGKYHPQNTYIFIPQLVQFAKSGYVVASIQHRTSHEAKFPAQLYDVKAAIRYLRANSKQYNIDPSRVGVWGTSSGAHLAVLAGTTGGVKQLEGQEGNENQSSRVQAVVDWYGPTDLSQMSKFPSDVEFDAPDSPESMLIGGPLQQNKEKVKMANPITYITSDDPPFLIMHGDKDMRVPYNQSVLLYEALKKANVEATMYKVKGAGHGGGFSQPQILNIVQKFFDTHLKNS